MQKVIDVKTNSKNHPIRTRLKEKGAGDTVISSEEDVGRQPVPNNSISSPDENVNGRFSLKQGDVLSKQGYDFTKSFEEQVDDWKNGKFPK